MDPKELAARVVYHHHHPYSCIVTVNLEIAVFFTQHPKMIRMIDQRIYGSRNSAPAELTVEGRSQKVAIL